MCTRKLYSLVVSASALLAISFSQNLPQAHAYNLAGRWSSTATNGGGLGQGSPTTLTWGIIDDGTNVNGSEGDSGVGSTLISMMDGLYGGGPIGEESDLTMRPWFTHFENSFNRWEALTGLTYNYEPNDTNDTLDSSSPSGSLGVRADVRIGARPIPSSPGNTLAYNYYPNTGDMVLDTQDASFFGNTSSNSRRLRNVLMHEAGHGIGLEHVESSGSGFLMEPSISTSFDGPQLDDIIAAHRHYGDVWEKNGGNNNAADAVSLGLLEFATPVAIGTDADNTVVSANDIDFVSIDDNSDNDYFSFSVPSGSLLSAVLTPKGPTYNEGPQNGSQSPFDSSAQSNLRLRIYDTDGTTLLATVDQSGLGGIEDLDGLILDDAGTYFARVTGAQNAAQLYELELTMLPNTFLEGDVNLDGFVTTGTGDPLTDDVAAFVAGWQTVLPTDDAETAWMKGDLDLNRISDLNDAFILHEALANAGQNTSELNNLAVPEPATCSLLLLSLACFAWRRPRQR